MNDVKLSRYISYVLRHNPSEANMSLDGDGYGSVEMLLKCLQKKCAEFSLDDLKRIVDEDDKGRYSFSYDDKMIRANQGHSATRINFDEIVPDCNLYHGTATKYIDGILANGIVSQGRHHVHLSDNMDTARAVGSRHGAVVVLAVDTDKMIKDGCKFYISENGVYLCEHVEPKYISIVEG